MIFRCLAVHPIECRLERGLEVVVGLIEGWQASDDYVVKPSVSADADQLSQSGFNPAANAISDNRIADLLGHGEAKPRSGKGLIRAAELAFQHKRGVRTTSAAPDTLKFGALLEGFDPHDQRPLRSVASRQQLTRSWRIQVDPLRPTDACGPWNDGEQEPACHPSSASWRGSHGGACERAGLVDMCASRGSLRLVGVSACRADKRQNPQAPGFPHSAADASSICGDHNHHPNRASSQPGASVITRRRAPQYS